MARATVARATVGQGIEKVALEAREVQQAKAVQGGREEAVAAKALFGRRLDSKLWLS